MRESPGRLRPCFGRGIMQVMEDEIIQEVHAARRKIAEECNYDFKELVARYKRLQAAHPERLVDVVPKSDPEMDPCELSK
jgi:hypothetical protein